MNSTSKRELKTGIEKLRRWLQEAIEVEHATIPPYFTAWLSIMEGHNEDCSRIVKSVLLEEMLHLTLAANLLNAVGGKPDLKHANFVPSYPHILPHSGRRFEIHIEKFSKQALITFLKIERPEPRGAKPRAKEFKTIGQFYAAVGKLLHDLCQKHGEESVFIGDMNRQILPEAYFGSGSIVVVKDLSSAQHAIRTIVDQGEGAEGIFDDDHNIFGKRGGNELAHYYRFNEMFMGRHYRNSDTPRDKKAPSGRPFKIDFSKVYPILKDTHRTAFSKSSKERSALDKFANSYGDLLLDLHDAFNGQRSRMSDAMARMFSLRQQAVALMKSPSGKGKGTLGLDFAQNSKKRS